MKDYFGLSGKVCVVTGAASGMGKAAAEMLVDLGAEVYAMDVNPVEVEGLAASIQVNLADKDSIDAAFAQVPSHVRAFLGIAGVSGANMDFMTCAKIDLIANKHICESILPERMEAGDAIAFITSAAGFGFEREGNKKWIEPVLDAPGWDGAVATLEKLPFAQFPGTMGYPYSKLAMNLYVAKLQEKLASRGIRVNAVLPAPTKTGLIDEFTAMAGGEEKILVNSGQAGRLATPEEMAEPTVFLVSDMARFVSGELMYVDFGALLGEQAGLTPSINNIDLDAILQMAMARAQQQ